MQILFLDVDGTNLDLYRYNADGSEAGAPTRLAITSDPMAWTYRQGMAWTGSEIGIAWIDEAQVARFVRIDPAGNLLGTPLALSPPGAQAALPEVAYHAGHVGVVWSDARTGAVEEYFSVVDTAGASATPALPLQPQGGSAAVSRLLFMGSGWGVLWTGGAPAAGTLHMTLISEDGARGVASVDIDTGTLGYQAATWTGSELAVIWKKVAPSTILSMTTFDGALSRHLAPTTLVDVGTITSPYPEVVWGQAGLVVAYYRQPATMRGFEVMVGAFGTDGRPSVPVPSASRPATSPWVCSVTPAWACSPPVRESRPCGATRSGPSS